MTKLLSGTLTCKSCGKVVDYENDMEEGIRCPCGGDYFADLHVLAKFSLKPPAGGTE
jgi:hypothetical protein